MRCSLGSSDRKRRRYFHRNRDTTSRGEAYERDSLAVMRGERRFQRVARTSTTRWERGSADPFAFQLSGDLCRACRSLRLHAGSATA
jgi:hypothetical protein